MKNLVLTTAAALSISASAVMAATVTIDFEGATGFYGPASTASDPRTNYLGTEISGLLFDASFQVLPGSANGPGQSGNVGRSAIPPFGGFPRGGDIGGSFDGFTVSSLSFVVGDSGGDLDIYRLFGFDALGNQVADSGVQSSNSAITVGITGTGIASFFLDIDDQPVNDGSSVVDNIVFETEISVVPLPASLPLLGFGLFALGAAARRRKG